MAVNPIPKGYHTITPMLIADDAAGLIEFIRNAFNGEVIDRMDDTDGSVMHASLKIGDSMLMLGQSSEKWPATVSTQFLYVPDVDASYKQGIAAGGKSLGEPKDEFWGDRMGGFSDNFGNQWWVATHVKEVAPEEMKRLMKEQQTKQKQAGASA